MTPDDMLEEQACLYALGALTGEELRAFEEILRDQPGLRQQVAELRAGAHGLAHALPPVVPPPELKARLMASLEAESRSPLPVPPASGGLSSARAEVLVKTPARSMWQSVLPWAAAAGFAAVAGWQWQRQQAVERERDLAQQTAAIFETNAREAAGKNSELAQEIQRAEAAMSRLAGERDQAVARVRTIETESESLRTQVAQLKEQNDLSNARVAVLGSLIKKKPEARAASVWSSETQSGVLVVENLPALPPGRDYQLWVLDPPKGAPISAGVFQVDANGAARVAFTAVETVAEPAQFAVTEEQQGGVPSPTMEKLVLAGK
jgi:anti-sigma-K factor RskA